MVDARIFLSSLLNKTATRESDTGKPRYLRSFYLRI